MDIAEKIQVTGFTRIASPRVGKSGARILAFFDCEVGPFLLTGCAFVRTKKNGLAVWPPKLDIPSLHARGIRIVDSKVLHAMVTAAQEAYRHMGGTDGEWMAREVNAELGPDAPTL